MTNFVLVHNEPPPHSLSYHYIDFARTFPPATPNIQTHPRGFLYQLLRPEFVFAYHKPLSRYAYGQRAGSGWLG